jgi:tripartite-type tricarboxylate transporter receptor subunit TctC
LASLDVLLAIVVFFDPPVIFAVGLHMKRRSFLNLAAGAAALPILPRLASAQSYPTRPVRLIVGFPAGGSGDIIARLLGRSLSGQLGPPFVIENRPGAASNLGTEAVAHAAADGYTLLLVTTSNAVNATLYEKLNFNFLRDIVPVAGICRAPNVLLVNPSVPAKTVAEFIAYARANPGRVNMGSGGVGSTSHGAGELFQMLAGVKLTHVPYRGLAPALADLIGGQVEVAFPDLPSSIEHIKAGQLRALAVTSATRLAALPEIPAAAEFVPGYEVSGWWGVGAPRNTPSEIIEKLDREIGAALGDPRLQAGIADAGCVPMPMRAAEFGRLLAAEVEKWGKVVKFANIKPE